MSRVIWKAELTQEKAQVALLHSVWRPLSFGNQEGTPVLWFEADTDSPKVQRLVFLVFTGEIPPAKAKYVGTATFGQGGWIVIHCYVQ